MGDARDWITEHSTLTENNQEEFADTVINVVGTVLTPGFYE